MRYSPRWFLGLVVAAGLSAGRAEAGFMYAFDQDSYTVSASGTVDVNVYLRGTDADSMEILSRDGLVSAGVQVQYGALDLNGNPEGLGSSEILSIADIIPNPLFDAPPPFLQTSSTAPVPPLIPPTGAFGVARLSEAADLLSPAVVATGPEGILLGTFRFTAGTPGLTTRVVVRDFSPFNQFISGTGEVLDPASNSILLNDVGITALDAPVSPVPAPSTMMLAAIGLSSLGIYGRFRRTAS